MSDQIGWPSATVALGFLGVLGAVTVASILKYADVDDALKYAGSQSALLGVLTGSAATYFFTRSTVETARSGQAAAEAEAQRARVDATEVAKTSADKVDAVHQELASARQEQVALSLAAERRWAALKVLIEDASLAQSKLRDNAVVKRAMSEV